MHTHRFRENPSLQQFFFIFNYTLSCNQTFTVIYDNLQLLTCFKLSHRTFKHTLSPPSKHYKSTTVAPRQRRRIHRGEALCSIYQTQQGLTAAEPEAIGVLQTCLPCCCPQDDTPPPPALSLAQLSSAHCLPLPQGVGVIHPSTRRHTRRQHFVSLNMSLFLGDPAN